MPTNFTGIRGAVVPRNVGPYLYRVFEKYGQDQDCAVSATLTALIEDPRTARDCLIAAYSEAYLDGNTEIASIIEAHVSDLFASVDDFGIA